MQLYQCHKQVRASKIVRIEVPRDREVAEKGGKILCTEDGSEHLVWRDSQFKNAEVGDYYVVYDDSYASRSPAKAFEEGYTAIDG